MASEEDYKKQFVNFLSDKGFIYGPEPEIYGGLAGFYTYGPLGKSLKNRIENTIRSVFTKFDFWEVECPTVMPAPVWKASGHLDGFSDPLIKDTDQNVYRVDKLIEEWCKQNNIDFSSMEVDEGSSHEHLIDVITKNNITAPNGKKLVPEITEHNLMMKTTIGHDTEAYNRPETATTTYLPFLRYVNFFREKLPFGVFQIGKAYRNEISPRQHVLRCREFTQAEGQLFIFERQKNDFEWFEEVKDTKLPLWSYQLQDKNAEPEMTTLQDALDKGILKNQAYAWTLNIAYQLFCRFGIPLERIRMRQHAPDERAFYADDAWDVEINFNTYGWTEVCGIHDRTDYDLTTHEKHSGTKLECMDEGEGKKTPHVIEIAFGSDRPTFAVLDIFYEPAEKGEGKPKLKVPYTLAPVEVAVFPLVNKKGIPEVARKVYGNLQKDFISRYDRSGSVGKRYLRQDEVGTPYCITVDFDSLDNNDVTIRDRDTTEQKRVKIEDLNSTIRKLLDKEIEFKNL
ncbi:MAG: glycine--tRNA ligase [Nanoarchaeota archaeon]